MAETVIKLRAEGGGQAKGEVDQTAASVERLGTVGDMARAGLSQVAGPLGGIVAAAGPVAAVAAAVGLVVKGLQEAIDKALEAERKVQVVYGTQTATIVAQRFGPEAPEKFVAQALAAGVGISHNEALAAAAGTVGLKSASQAQAVYNSYLNLRRSGMVDPGYVGSMAGLVEQGMTPTQAEGVTARTMALGMGTGSLGGRGGVLGAAKFANVETSEALALNQIVGDVGGGPMQASALLRSLRDDPKVRAHLKRKGLENAGLEEQLRGLADLRKENIPGAVQGIWSGIQENLGDFGDLASKWAGVMGGGGAAPAGGQVKRAQTEATWEADREAAKMEDRPFMRRLGKQRKEGVEEIERESGGIPVWAGGHLVAAGSLTIEAIGRIFKDNTKDAAYEAAKERQRIEGSL